jgi:hypothetical protein
MFEFVRIKTRSLERSQKIQTGRDSQKASPIFVVLAAVGRKRTFAGLK